MSWLGGIMALLLVPLLVVVQRKCILYFYRLYPKDSHFYHHQTYRRYSHTGFCVVLYIAYLMVYVFFEMMQIIPQVEIKLPVVLPLAFFLVWLSSVDLKLQLIPFSALWGILIVGMLYVFASAAGGYTLMLLWQGVLSLSFEWWVHKILLITIIWTVYWLFFKPSIGQADIYFLSLLVLIFPLFEWLLLLLTSSILGLLFCFMLTLCDRRTNKPFAFGPWIALATWFSFLVV